MNKKILNLSYQRDLLSSWATLNSWVNVGKRQEAIGKSQKAFK